MHVRPLPHPAMHPAVKLTITLVLLILLGGLGAADYFLAEGGLRGEVAREPGQETGSTDASDGTMDVPGDDAPQMPPPPGAVAKNQGATVAEAAARRGLEVRETATPTLLEQVAGEGNAINTAVLLQDGDRAGAVAWIESPDVKAVFSTLKEALITAFSPRMRGLRDETLQTPGAPVRNVLSFLDPGLSEEQIVFVRVRERLFEFHLAADSEATMHAFIDELTGR